MSKHETSHRKIAVKKKSVIKCAILDVAYILRDFTFLI